MYMSTDIDECARGLDDCNDNATCTNTPGSYMCNCFMGFTGDGKSCAREWLTCIILCIMQQPNTEEYVVYK